MFMDRGCSFCHYGPNLGGAGYYPLGLVVLPGADLQAADEVAGAAAADPDAEEFTFRTAPLCNIALTAPYFHNGIVKTLDEAVTVMAKVQLDKDLSKDDVADIVAFLNSLSGEFPKQTMPVLPATPGTTFN
jgi:cytochrome c peroxidase